MAKNEHHIRQQFEYGYERHFCTVSKPGREIRNAERSVNLVKIAAKSEPNSPSDECGECGAPLLRVSLDDLMDDDERIWTRRFMNGASDLGPGRYRCPNCSSEWWQFPVSVAS
jgi:uncharacterized protein with PIN domain